MVVVVSWLDGGTCRARWRHRWRGFKDSIDLGLAETAQLTGTRTVFLQLLARVLGSGEPEQLGSLSPLFLQHEDGCRPTSQHSLQVFSPDGITCRSVIESRDPLRRNRCAPVEVGRRPTYRLDIDQGVWVHLRDMSQHSGCLLELIEPSRRVRLSPAFTSLAWRPSHPGHLGLSPFVQFVNAADGSRQHRCDQEYSQQSRHKAGLSRRSASGLPPPLAGSSRSDSSSDGEQRDGQNQVSLHQRQMSEQSRAGGDYECRQRRSREDE